MYKVSTYNPDQINNFKFDYPKLVKYVSVLEAGRSIQVCENKIKNRVSYFVKFL